MLRDLSIIEFLFYFILINFFIRCQLTIVFTFFFFLVVLLNNNFKQFGNEVAKLYELSNLRKYLVSVGTTRKIKTK